MMKQQKRTKATKPKELYLRVSNIHWNEGPEEGYTGPKAFWFVVNADTYKACGDDPINKLALFQLIENELEDSGEYGGIVSDLLEFEWVHKEWLKDKNHFTHWGLKRDDSIEITDLTDIKL